MRIPVTLLSSSSNAKLPSGIAKISNEELVLIELQGSLEVEVTHPRERDGKFIGSLAIDDATNRPTLLIGNHLLEGKIAALPKPYAILVKTSITRSSGVNSDTMEVDEDSAGAVDSMNNDSQDTSAGWTITGIVKKKIIFSKRPMPVMGKKLH